MAVLADAGIRHENVGERNVACTSKFRNMGYQDPDLA